MAAKTDRLYCFRFAVELRVGVPRLTAISSSIHLKRRRRAGIRSRYLSLHCFPLVAGEIPLVAKP